MFPLSEHRSKDCVWNKSNHCRISIETGWRLRRWQTIKSWWLKPLMNLRLAWRKKVSTLWFQWSISCRYLFWLLGSCRFVIWVIFHRYTLNFSTKAFCGSQIYRPTTPILFCRFWLRVVPLFPLLVLPTWAGTIWLCHFWLLTSNILSKFIDIQISSIYLFGFYWLFPCFYNSLLVNPGSVSAHGDSNDVLYLYPKEIWTDWWR